MGMTAVCRLDELEDGRLMVETDAGEDLLVIQHEGQLYVLDAMCPHQYAPLLGGDIDEEGVLECPLHGWRFRLSDGRSPDSEFICVRRYEATTEDGQVLVAL